MQNTNIIAAEQTPNTISASNAVFNVQALGQLTAFAELMAQSAVTVPKHLAGKPADCMAIVMQAMQWGMNPYAVAQKTHLVNGVLGYEAQLVNAVISSSSAIQGRFHYEYGGDWEKIAGQKDGRDESGLFIRVGAVLRGETDITWGENIYLADITTRNSPLWKTAPKQQIAYLAVKYWARLYCPEVILGVYSPDEVEQRTEKEINPVPARVSLAEISGDNVTTTTTTSARESAVNVDSIADEFRDRIEAAEDVDGAKAVRVDIESAKATLGSTLFTELKNKAVKRYYLVDARNKVEAAINSLPQPDEPDAAERFTKAEQTLTAAKRHLGDELYEKFSITLLDMKPEYVD
ncbi:enterohemolysin [Atlantibacter subterranea]|uniref:Enterohemolysin n=1 Tax=Atlantibacter subterraneus TaxID=255519 RepID=A0A427V281_9ENTR|nr:RecT family recombinase [Atlantibacter subterranea]RSB62826.1 enterohemolysin [Atlantibacter subterranea]RSE02011.1 enterohemolysin [Atlantibacter subterranea]RSE26837.1 enterohemolysin [Atlantibacter subterranea]